MKKWISLIIIFLLTGTTSFASELIMEINNNRAVLGDEVLFVDSKNPDVVPFIVDGRTLVPVRFISEALGFAVNWDEESQTVTLINSEKMVKLTIDSRVMTVESGMSIEIFELDVPPQIINARTFLPLRAIAENALGFEVYWDGISVIIISQSTDISVMAHVKAAFLSEKQIFGLRDFPIIDGSTATNPFAVELAKKTVGITETTARGILRMSKTHQAIVNLIMGEADIIFVTHPSDGEFAFAKEMGVELEIVPFSKEGFVFLNHKNNRVDDLTVEQIKQIYEGVITNWSEVGGANTEIIPYQRQANSGSQSNMVDFMGDRELMTPPTEQIIMDMGGLIESVGNYQNSDKSLGYSMFYYAEEMYINPNIKLMKVNGVTPTSDTVRSMEYPIVSYYYAVIRKADAPDSPARRMLDWVMSEDGQALVDESGLVSI